MPLKFCGHRWLENGPAAQRALEILNDVKQYISSVEKGRYKGAKCKSYFVVLNACKDALLPVKLNFFISVVRMLQPFLAGFQKDWPMLPFLADDLKKLIFNLLDTFKVLKSSVVSDMKKMCDFSNVNFDESKNSISNVSAGFVGNSLLKKLAAQKEISDKAVMDIQHDCQNFIIAVVKKISEKSPVSNQFVRCLSSLDPRRIYQNSDSCHKKMSIILKELVRCKKINEDDCDLILLEFLNFLNSVANDESFKSFDVSTQRLDVFLMNHLCTDEYRLLWGVIKRLLLFSHGQASVERGFSINKKIETENMKEETYVAKRLVKDALALSGGAKNFEVTKEIKIAVRGARQKYRQYLELKAAEKKIGK
ncbi:LOW QUALITY PROTEIN: uncharacterized protein LOC129230498 [Uloborus diversus]|uniref:LOW QUALITY PROTEIN: uncharacterized protein LOC129230498 n=1 Tax=Uloborus diversus TaxID=327109 RepID=UPI00240A0926|nr:LOW QUALITY PROTEIN: uncharacterized protein LOC129230498 [Uloborus diversus]